MDIRDLRYFLACAELGHVEKAARRLGRTQPALTKSVRRLEAELKTRLFEREGRGLRLTPMGHSLAAHARKLLRGVEEATREVTEVAHGSIGHVRVGAAPTMAEWILPGLLQSVLARTPALTLHVRVGLGETLRQDLRNGSLDLVLAPLLAKEGTDLQAVPILDDIMVVAARPDHPLVGRQVTCRDLAAFSWLLPIGTSLDWIAEAFARHGLGGPALQIEVSSILVLRRVVRFSDLLTFISRRDLDGGPTAKLAEIDIPELRLPRQFGLITHREAYTAIAARRLIDQLSAGGHAFDCSPRLDQADTSARLQQT
jgi:DNA-binding transcriptional LysR family regulator